jgi:phage terminase large subunit
MSNNGRISNYSQYERKKVNGIERVENYNINNDKRKQNIIPQNTIKYKYDKDTDIIPKSNNNTCNRIPINIPKYSRTNIRQNSSLNRLEKKM